MFRQKSWDSGTLFHTFRRFSRSGDGITDRLPAILKEGLWAPGHCEDGRVVSDINVTVTGFEFAYDSLVFLHKYKGAGSVSDLLLATWNTSDSICIVIDDQVPVKTPEEMGDDWPVLSQDEVYVTEPIPPENFTDIYMRETYAREEKIADSIARLGITTHSI